MERGGGSFERSGIAAKTPRSLKENSDRVGRTMPSTGTNQNLQKKRSRVVVSDSESSEEFMKPPRKRVDPKTLGAKGCSEEKFDRNGHVRRKNEASGSLMKKTKLDIFEFDEYDGFDSANLMRKRFDNGNVGVSGRSSFAHSSVGRSGSGSDGLFARRTKPYVNGARGMSSQEESSSESDSDELIRVQGRNGVLKVKVSNKTSTIAASINHQEAERYERQPSSRKLQKRESVLVKPTFRKSNNVDNDSESEESDVLRRKYKSKTEINTKPKSRFSESAKPVMGEERKGRRNGGTEKQRLRERIKGMLIDAGWTIDYKPRRNQSYLDSVYVNPSGTAYWSIIKAYDALLKQLKDEENDAGPRKDTAKVFSVSEDIMNNLARKVKKTWNEKTKKGKNITSGSDDENKSDGDDEGRVDIETTEERMGSFIKKGGKSTKKGRNRTSWDDLHSKSKRPLYYNDARPSSRLDSHFHGRKSKKIGRCTLLVRSSKDKKNPAVDGFNPYSGKKTLLSWLIESGVVQLRQKVQYMNRRGTKVMLEGWITREGIHCVCCSKILTLSRFEIHAGSKSCQPFQNIYLESGTSLLQCLVRAWKMQKDATKLGFHQVDTDGDDPNDDACGICGDGGDLICCDGCPSTYHQTCLGVQVLPPGDWHCPNCTCKFCDAAVAFGDEDGILLSLLSCSICGRRYHQSCVSELEADKVQSLGSASSFCGPKCLELFEKLQKYLGAKNELEGGYSWSLIHRVDNDSDTNPQKLAQRVESNSKLAVGLAIMDECFLPIVDRRSGINLIRNVLYNCGSNFNRINFTGFYTAILERGDEIICAASLRFHGMQLAEMPFIGTRHIYRRQGMCRRLFDAIESAMRSLKVEKLVIPAIPDFLHAWTGNFGFSPLDDSVRKEMRSLNTLVFPGIDMLQKPLLHEENIIAAADSENIPVSVDTVMDTIPKPEVEFSPGEECVINSSCQIINTGNKHCEDTRSSCEDDHMNVNVDADASLAAEEIKQVSGGYKTCPRDGSTDLSSVSQEARSEHNSLNVDNNILNAGSKLAESKDDAFVDGFLL